MSTSEKVQMDRKIFLKDEKLSDLQIRFHEIKYQADVRFVSKGVQQLETHSTLNAQFKLAEQGQY